MSAATTKLAPLSRSVLENRRLAREWKTVRAMIEIYCRDQHGAAGSLCVDCAALTGYVRLRLDRCRFGEDKPTCAKCPVHCYQRSRRDEIKAVMRYSGPKMIWEHPWLSLFHLVDGFFRKVAD
ncbi:MAG TPA: nitrous oxide-stimulated promoter family protein [Verrucomicrobiae bacterium]|nr:nitrous oxide-stimulated promoter family protein [Verrucomicrobiae bacterium]